MTAPRVRQAAAAVLVVALGACLASCADRPATSTALDDPLVITDPAAMDFDPNGEFIFPSVWHAAAHLEDPLGAWYLYTAPHDEPGGIALLYADHPSGPWTEHDANPLIGADWPPHFSVTHVSSPDAIWSESDQMLYLFFHGENDTTRFATSTDGIEFVYKGVAVQKSGGDDAVTESSYARVVSVGPGRHVMLFMDRTDSGRRIRVADSTDLRDWVVRPEPFLEPGGPEGTDLSAANLWLDGSSWIVVYHGADGRIWQRTTDDRLASVGPPTVLLEDDLRVAAPELVTVDGVVYCFFEWGPRRSAVVAVTELPDRPPGSPTSTV